jgi:hypothetical protein
LQVHELTEYRFGPKKILEAAQKIKELHAMQPEVVVAHATEVATLSSCPEDPPTQPKPIPLPETPIEMVPQTPIELVCQSPLGEAVSETKDQMRVLIVDDNDINLKVSDVFKIQTR